MGQSIGVVQVCCSKVAQVEMQVEMQAVRITGQCEANKLQPVKMKQVVGKAIRIRYVFAGRIFPSNLLSFSSSASASSSYSYSASSISRVPSVTIDLKKN